MNSASKKIVHYNPRFYPIMGGGEVYIANIMQNITDYKYEVVSNALSDRPLIEVYHDNTLIKRFLPYDLNLKPLKDKRANRLLFLYRLFSDISRQKRKISYIAQADIDLLHVHGIGFETNFLRVDNSIGVNFFTRSVNFRSIKKPSLLTIHNLISPFIQSNVVRKYESSIIDQFDNIICVDKKIESIVRENIEKKNQDKNIWFIPNSVDTDLFKFKELPERNKLKIGFIGRLEASRGLNFLHQLISNLPDYVELLVVGSANKLIVDKFKSESRISNIKFYETIDNNKIPDILEGIDILFNPVQAEGISRISLEAMSSGRPVIMIDKGDRYPVIHGETGYLINDDLDSLITLLSYLRTNRNELRKLGEKARIIVEKEFSNKVVFPQIKKIYEELIV